MDKNTEIQIPKLDEPTNAAAIREKPKLPIPNAEAPAQPGNTQEQPIPLRLPADAPAKPVAAAESKQGIITLATSDTASQEQDPELKKFLLQNKDNSYFQMMVFLCRFKNVDLNALWEKYKKASDKPQFLQDAVVEVTGLDAKVDFPAAAPKDTAFCINNLPYDHPAGHQPDFAAVAPAHIAPAIKTLFNEPAAMPPQAAAAENQEQARNDQSSVPADLPKDAQKQPSPTPVVPGSGL